MWREKWGVGSEKWEVTKVTKVKRKWRGLFETVAADMGYKPRQEGEFTVREFAEACDITMSVDTARNKLNRLVTGKYYSRRVGIVNGLACMLYRKVKK